MFMTVPILYNVPNQAGQKNISCEVNICNYYDCQVQSGATFCHFLCTI